MSAVVYKRVDGFLKHTFFVSDNYIGSFKLHHSFKAVVSVDNAPVQIVKVGGGEAAAVQKHHGADIRRNNGYNVKYHPFGAVSALSERFNHVKPFENLHSLLSLSAYKLGFKLFRKSVQIDFLKEKLYRFRAHSGAEIVLIALSHIVVFLFGEELTFCENSALAGIGNDIFGEIKHLFKPFGRDIQHLPYTGGSAPEIPYMRNGSRKLDAAHTLSSDLAPCHLYAAALAGLSLKTDFLVFSAGAFPVLRGSENTLAEKAVPFRLLSAVIYGFGAVNHSVAPLSYLIG